MLKVRVCGFALVMLSTLFALNSNAQVVFDSPKSPTFNYLSTLDILTGYPTLNWSTPAFDPLYPNPTGYIIYRKEYSAQYPSGIYIAIDTVDNTKTSYTDFNVSINNARYTYVLTSKGPTMPSQITSSHSNIFISSFYDSCFQKLDLSWTKYEGWGNHIEKYDVYIGNNPNPATYTLHATLPGTTNMISIMNVLENTDYFFYIEATKDGDQKYSTKSNLLHKFTRMYPLVLSYSPSDNATNALPDENLVLSFSGKVKQGSSGNITIYNSNSTVFESIPYNDSRISILDNIVTINPVNTFQEGASYYVKIDPNVIENLNGDSFSGIENNDTWNFTVAVFNSIVDLNINWFAVSPNPSNGLFTISSVNKSIEEISIYDAKGLERIRINISKLVNNQINLLDSPKGLYFLRFKVSGKYFVKKLLVL